jgi:hypothetical protein
MNSFGFIITRHVNSEKTNRYWNHCVKCLRSLYPAKKIIIIDDNSNYNFIKADFDYQNVEIIQSEFKSRGELLPYYYFIKNKFFENAVILHDSVFFHKRVNFEHFLGINVIPLWFFYPDKENINNTLRIASKLYNSHPIKQKITLNDGLLGLQHTKWYGCFGVQSFINHDFLLYLENKYKIINLITVVNCRADRCSLERIFGCIFFTENSKIHSRKSVFGDIMKYYKWGYSYEQYENDFKNKKIPKEVVKVWTGR